MAGKLVKYLLVATVLYYVAVELYVFYHIFVDYADHQDQRVKDLPPINFSSLPDAIQTERRIIVDGLVSLYELDPNPSFWEHFQSGAIFEDLLFELDGGTGIMKTFTFVLDIGVLQKGKVTVTHEIHYASRIWVDLEFEFTMIVLGSQKLTVGFWLYLFEYSQTSEISLIQDEVNHVRLITHRNTMFPVGWSAEIFRAIHGKLVECMAELYFR